MSKKYVFQKKREPKKPNKIQNKIKPEFELDYSKFQPHQEELKTASQEPVFCLYINNKILGISIKEISKGSFLLTFHNINQ